MVCGELYFDDDAVLWRVFPDDDAFAEAASELVCPRGGGVPGVAADAALAVILVPLSGETPAVELMVVVVVGRVEAVAPGGGARWRLDESPVTARCAPSDR